MTSRYLRLSAEQVTITPEADSVESVLSEDSRRRISQSHRSASVKGWPFAIFSTFSCVWN